LVPCQGVVVCVTCQGLVVGVQLLGVVVSVPLLGVVVGVPWKGVVVGVPWQGDLVAFFVPLVAIEISCVYISGIGKRGYNEFCRKNLPGMDDYQTRLYFL
jgi:hypothetical protein